jgi:N-acetylglucosaminyldiphosphoundecaprenol N-acetyl-beta-D-mannosaminyltransferase
MSDRLDALQALLPYDSAERGVNVLGVEIRLMTADMVDAAFERFMRDDRPYSVYIVNAATTNLCYQDPAYRHCVNRADLVLNDGTGVGWAARWQGRPFTHNHVGTDLIPRQCDIGRHRGMRVFLLGGLAGVAERAASTLSARHPGIVIAGCHHGYIGPNDDERICRLINEARPDLLLVAMGNPIQERWIDRNLHRLRRGVAVGVGGLFDHLAGNLQRAPRWVRSAGCEWVQILLQQPHKWPRYLLGNPLFIYRMTLGRPREAKGRPA